MPELAKVIESPGSAVAGVTSLNGEKGAVNIIAGANVTVTPAGQTIAIASPSNSQIITANGYTIKQDSNGYLGIFNTSGVEIGYLQDDGSGNLQINSVPGKIINLNGAFLSINTYVSIVGLLAAYNGLFTSGLGLPGIYATYSQTGKNLAVTNAINYTPPATAGTYRLSFSVDVRVATTDNFHLVATWKDAAGVSRSQTLGGSDSAGSALVAGAITNTIGVGTYSGSILIQIDNSATAITLSTVGTFTTVTYDLAATLEQLA